MSKVRQRELGGMDLGFDAPFDTLERTLQEQKLEMKVFQQQPLDRDFVHVGVRLRRQATRWQIAASSLRSIDRDATSSQPRAPARQQHPSATLSLATSLNFSFSPANVAPDMPRWQAPQAPGPPFALVVLTRLSAFTHPIHFHRTLSIVSSPLPLG